MKKTKKLLTAVLCVAIALICTVNAGAAETTEHQTEAVTYSGFKVLNSTKNIPENKLYLSTFNQSSEAINVIRLDAANNTNESNEYSFKDYVTGDYVSLRNNTQYAIWSGLRTTSGNSLGICAARKFSNLHGKYQKVRIKLSDFDSYFKSDGSHNQTISGETFTYHFGLPEKVDNKTYYSSLIFLSGQAFTSVTPDKNGEVEVYVSTQIGVITSYTTDFGITTSNSSERSGGTHRTIAICKGNAKINNDTVSIDDATHIQLYLACMLNEEFTDVQKFNADANNDGIVDIKDATYIQFYLADLL